MSHQGKLPNRQEIFQAISSFSPKQKISFLIVLGIFIASVFGIIWRINSFFLVNAAVPGGTLTEGSIGFPNHINPLLSITDADRDVTALVYSGLTKINSQGEIIPDLAESFNVSDNGLIYSFKLKKDLTWHDGQPLTTDDIEYTIQKAQDPNLKSPKRAAWEGVRIKKDGPYQIEFILKKPYSSFLENTTIGIIPKHIWKNIKTEAFLLSEQNLKGIGSGPYKISSLTRDLNGLPRSYVLEAFKNYSLGTPKITTLILRFYDNEEQLERAYNQGEIESFGSIPPESAEKLKKAGAQVREISLPRSFAVFFNQNQTIFSDKNIRQAIDLATDKQKIVDEILHGYGTILDYPVPPGSIGYIEDKPEEQTSPQKAIELLEKNGWQRGEDGIFTKTDKLKKTTTKLEFILSTANVPELKDTANELAEQWKKVGIRAVVQVYDLSDLDQNLIRPRKFEALLFGESLGRDSDLYSFWHSSQRLAPGLNISQYTNSTADKLLEEARQAKDLETKADKYERFQQELVKDVPVVFLYSPSFLYVLPEKIKNADFPSLLVPSERFSTTYRWHIYQERVWKIFTTSK